MSAPPLTHLSVALFAPELRDLTLATRTCLVGALAGVLFYFGSRNLIDARILFLVWQPAVATSHRPRAGGQARAAGVVRSLT